MKQRESDIAPRTAADAERDIEGVKAEGRVLMPHFTHSNERRAQIGVLESLGLEWWTCGGNLFALHETDTARVRALREEADRLRAQECQPVARVA